MKQTSQIKRSIKRSVGEIIFDSFNVLLVVVLCLVTIYPLLYTIFASFSDAKELLKHEGVLLAPLSPITTEGYRLVFRNSNILRGFLNSVKLVGVGTLLSVFMTMLAAFVVTRKYFKPAGLMMKLIMVTMFFNGGLIPTFFVVRNTGLYNSFWSLIIPNVISTYYLIILRTFFKTIPDSLEESALLDGATDLQVLLRIYFPLCLPSLAVITLYYAVDYWNDWYQALLYIRERQLYPLQMFLREVLIENDTADTKGTLAQVTETYTRELVKYCTVVVSTLPILALYPFLQKYFVKGMMIGAVKG